MSVMKLLVHYQNSTLSLRVAKFSKSGPAVK